MPLCPRTTQSIADQTLNCVRLSSQLALDHPTRVEGVCVQEAPTELMLETEGKAVGTGQPFLSE